jgi:hypothetical protein
VFVVAVHESVFFGLPVVALELVGNVVFAGLAPRFFERLG